MFRRYALLGLLVALSLTLLFVLQSTLVQGAIQLRHTEFSTQKLLTATPHNARIMHPVDIDQDGDLDLFSGGTLSGQLIWYENRGLDEPAFAIHMMDTVFDDVIALETADLDTDGDLDLIVGALPGDTIYWYENQGDLPVTFTEHQMSTGVNVPRSIKTADLDNDGDLDIAVASAMDDTVAWYENTNTLFTKHTITDTFDGAYALYPADLDKNGYIDLVAAAYNADTLVWFAHDGSPVPTFTAHVITDTAVEAAAVFVADVDEDGHLDILSASVGDNTIAWYESDGATVPTFTPHVVSDAAVAPWAVSVADVDKDGDLDVLSGSTGSGQLIWYESDGAALPNFTLHEVATAAYSNSVFAEDVNEDSYLDLLTIKNRQIVWYENDGTLLPDFVFHYAVTPTFGAHGVYAADLDSDGDVDVLSSSADDGQVAWYESDGGAEPMFTAHTITTDTVRPLRVIAADLNGDKHLDVVSASRLDGKIAWYANNGTQPPAFTMYTITTALDHPVSLDSADMDGDGDLDLISGASNIPVAWYENSGGSTPTFTTHEIYTDITGVFAIVAVDVDGDKDVDIVGGSANEHLYWFENNGAAPPTFTPHTIATYLYSQHVYAADVNGDGAIDILSTSGLYWNNDTVAWYENDGATIPSFTPHIITTDTVTTKFVYATDIDQDGDMDVFSASQEDDKVAWYESDGADPPNFTTHVLSELADGARSLFAADLNGDGHQDLLFASFEDGKIGWHQNIPPLYELFLPVINTTN